MKKGGRLEAEVRTALQILQMKDDQVWFSRFYDSFIRVGNGGMGIVKKPFDFITIVRSMAIALECKQTVQPFVYFNSVVREHQLKHLNDLKKCGGLSFFIVSFRSETPKTAYLVPATEYDNLVGFKLNGPKCEENKNIIKLLWDDKYKCWDLTVLYKKCREEYEIRNKQP